MSHQRLLDTRFSITLLSGLVVSLTSLSTACADILVHETFSDNDIRDDSPAVWEGTCFQDECGPAPPTAELNLENGQAIISFSAFAMWRLISVGGVEVEPDNNWSIRARVTPQRGEAEQFLDAHSIVGVGTDEYFWGAASHGMSEPETRSSAANGRFIDANTSDGTLPFFQTSVVQLDISPDGLETHVWPADDPANTLSIHGTVRFFQLCPFFGATGEDDLFLTK